MASPSLVLPGVLYVGEDDRTRLVAHVGPAAGWMSPKGILRWSREVSVVLRDALTEDVRRETRAVMPHEQLPPARFPLTYEAASRAPLVAVASKLVPRLVQAGVRVHTVGLDRLTSSFFYIAEGGGEEAVQVQGDLVHAVGDMLGHTADNAAIERALDGLVDRLLRVLSRDRVSELAVELAAALPRFATDGSGSQGLDVEAFERDLRALVGSSDKYTTVLRDAASKIAGASGPRVEVPLYSEARKVPQEAFELTIGGHKLSLPAHELWVLSGPFTDLGAAPPAQAAQPVEATPAQAKAAEPAPAPAAAKAEPAPAPAAAKAEPAPAPAAKVEPAPAPAAAKAEPAPAPAAAKAEPAPAAAAAKKAEPAPAAAAAKATPQASEKKPASAKPAVAATSSAAREAAPAARAAQPAEPASSKAKPAEVKPAPASAKTDRATPQPSEKKPAPASAKTDRATPQPSEKKPAPASTKVDRTPPPVSERKPASAKQAAPPPASVSRPTPAAPAAPAAPRPAMGSKPKLDETPAAAPVSETKPAAAAQTTPVPAAAAVVEPPPASTRAPVEEVKAKPEAEAPAQDEPAPASKAGAKPEEKAPAVAEEKPARAIEKRESRRPAKTKSEPEEIEQPAKKGLPLVPILIVIAILIAIVAFVLSR